MNDVSRLEPAVGDALSSWASRGGDIAVQKQPSTAELPMTPDHRVAVRHFAKSERQVVLGMVAFVFTIVLPLPFAPGRGQPELGNVLIAELALLFIALAADSLLWRRSAEVALRRGVFVRASGPIRVRKGRRSSTIYIGDVTVKYVSAAFADQIRALPWGMLDYAPRARVVFEQRDADGELIYRNPTYRPEALDDVGPEPSIRKGIAWGVAIAAAFHLVALLIFFLVAPRP
jgi:hypothetical protein